MDKGSNLRRPQKEGKPRNKAEVQALKQLTAVSGGALLPIDEK